MAEKLRLLGYEFRNAWVSMKRHWLLCLSSITTIALCLSLVAFFIVIGFHVSSFSSNLARDLSIHAIAADEIESEEDLNRLRNELESLDNVASVQFSSRENELELMIAEKGQAFSAYRGEDNPLSNAYFIYLSDQEAIDETAARISQVDGIVQVQYGGSSVSDLASMLDLIQTFAIFFVIILVALALYLIYSTIKTSIESRQAEISIQKTVGATASFISRPFEIEGMSLGLFGAILPVLMVAFGYPALYNALNGRLFINAFVLQRPLVMVFFSIIILIAAGMGMGWLASYLAIHRSLKSIR